MIKIKKILVPIDFSEGSSLAFSYATTLASEYGSEIHLLNVVEEEALSISNIGGDPLNTADKWRQQSKERLEKYIPSEYKHLPFITVAKGGLIYQAILDYAKEIDTNLIIMGSNGKAGFVDSWLGSTSYEVARKSPCAVLTVKPQGKGFLPNNKAF